MHQLIKLSAQNEATYSNRAHTYVRPRMHTPSPGVEDIFN